jgi:hypothetical protein
MTNASDDETFFSRWSRQKRAQPPPGKRQSAPSAPASETDAPEEPFDLTKLPNLDDLTADSDITAFLQKGVPEALKKLALRRMWALDPAIRDFVEVAENQWDFNASGGIYGLYQDIAEGGDVSLWLAQAAQSVPHHEQRPEIAALDSDSAGQPSGNSEVAAQHGPATLKNSSATPAPQDPSSDDASVSDVTIQHQVAEMPTQPSHAEAPAAHGGGTSRRRHGGALPS